MDPRIASLETLVTGPKLIAGMGEGPCRCCHVARIVGVPLEQKPNFYRWLEAEQLLLAPISPHWGENPLAGCVDLGAIRQRLRRAIKRQEVLPFYSIHIQELNHD